MKLWEHLTFIRFTRKVNCKLSYYQKSPCNLVSSLQSHCTKSR
uniref:Uncharacterized protein n=1 Tax=Anguilla anguilla TaxID=7936 RepID=A0A0E9Q6J0_ANGAN